MPLRTFSYHTLSGTYWQFDVFIQLHSKVRRELKTLAPRVLDTVCLTIRNVNNKTKVTDERAECWGPNPIIRTHHLRRLQLPAGYGEGLLVYNS